MDSDDRTSEVIDLSQHNTHGFCPGYTLRRHKYESLANAGSHEARKDWADYVAPCDKFGGCNPYNGNFTAVVMPGCRPERIRLVAYVLEYAFLHDNVIECLESTKSPDSGDVFTLESPEARTAHLKAMRKQLQAKMMVQLTSIDSACSKRIMREWEIMLSRTLKEKDKNFQTLEEYVGFRIVDTGAPFTESMLLWGMGITMTEEEDKQVADVIYPLYAALGLANDYFSFDREWEEAKEPDAPKPVNAVWHYMRWRDVDISTAKELVKNATNEYERKFLDLCDEFRTKNAPIPEKLDRYLTALSYMVSGNIFWSLNCPRYHPEFRYDPNAGLEDALTAKHREPLKLSEEDDGDETGRRPSIESTTVSNMASGVGSVPRASTPASSVDVDTKSGASVAIPSEEKLGPEHLKAPYEYVSSQPSKGVRDQFVDALNLWAQLPEEDITGIKGVINHLHNTSLILDDIEDGSSLRRGQPAAHIVFSTPQTINSGCFAIVEAISKAKELRVPNAEDIILEQLKELHVGQSHDLQWTRHGACPTEEEYIEMVMKKTGGLFRLLSRLMSGGMDQNVASDVDKLVTLTSVYFQIRDDYQNLNSAEYESQKGFCEDLDEGKFSFPLVHCLNSKPDNLQLRGVLQRRQDEGGLDKPLKCLVLESLGATGSLDYTLETLKDLERQIYISVAQLEAQFGTTNWVLRMILQKLSVS